MDPKKMKLYSDLKKDPALGLFRALEDMRKEMQTFIDAGLKKIEADLPNLSTVKGITALRGEQGAPGYTPVKGKDYVDGKDGHTPTAPELERVILPLIPKIENGKDGKDADEKKITQEVIKKIRLPKDGRDGERGKDGKDGSPDKPLVVAAKLNTLTEAVDPKVIKGYQKTLERIYTSIREKKSSPGGGGMGNVQHQEFSTSSATTSITTSRKIAGGGNALWAYYNGQQLMKGTHFNVGSDQKTITFLIALQDSTKVSVTYIRT